MRDLVVGVDGAPPSLRALEWAAETVGPRGQIHAVAAVSPATELAVVPAPTGRQTYLQLLQDELETVWTDVVRARVGTVTAVAMDGSAADALTEVAAQRRADAIVVGAHVPARTMPKTIGTTTRPPPPAAASSHVSPKPCRRTGASARPRPIRQRLWG